MFDFDGKVALVTGATSGIGRAAAKAFASAGANVVFSARSDRVGSDLKEELSRLGVKSVYNICDVSVERDAAALVEIGKERFGKINFAFNNAGIFASERMLHEHATEQWDKILATNLTSVYFFMKHEIRAMLSRPIKEPAVIVNNASIVAHRGSTASGVAYTVAKHGILGLTRQAAVAYVDDNIRCNSVSPGPTLTKATRLVLEGPPDEVKFSRLSAAVRQTRFGGDCYAYGLLASGFVDLVVEAKMKPYDYMALVPVIEGAGGIICDWTGKPLGIASDGHVLAAANIETRDEALQYLSL